MFNTRPRCRGHDRLGMIRHAEPGRLDHVEVVRAVTHGERRLEPDTLLGGEPFQCGEFRVAPEDRVGDITGQAAIGFEERVRVVFMESDQRGDAAGEEGEAARNQGAAGAGRAHRRDQLHGARHQLGFFPGPLHGFDWQALQHADALAQRAFEVEFAIHRALRDGGDAVLDAGLAGEFVQRLGGDDGAVHVGDQQPLAPTGRRLGDHVHRPIGQGDARGGIGLFSGKAGEGQVGGFLRRQPGRRADGGTDAGQRIARGVQRRDGEPAGRGDQGQNMVHACRGMPLP